MDNKKENRRLAVFRLGSLLYLLLTLPKYTDVHLECQAFRARVFKYY
jgi:hypothetical protein